MEHINEFNLDELVYTLFFRSKSAGFSIVGLENATLVKTIGISEIEHIAIYSNGVILRNRTLDNNCFELFSNVPLTLDNQTIHPNNFDIVIIG